MSNPYLPPSAPLDAVEAPSPLVAMAAPRPPRGGCLTLFLGLMVPVNSVLAISYAWAAANGSEVEGASAGPGHLAVLTAGCVLNVASGVALWRWRRWGLYGFAVTTVLALVVNLSMGVEPISVIPGVLGLVLLTALVWPVYEHLT